MQNKEEDLICVYAWTEHALQYVSGDPPICIVFWSLDGLSLKSYMPLNVLALDKPALLLNPEFILYSYSHIQTEEFI